MDSLVVSLTTQDTSTSIHHDISILNNVANTFMSLDSDDLLIRHFGIELKNYNERLQDKLRNVRDSLENMKEKYPNEIFLNDILSKLNSEIDQSRSESKLLEIPNGFVNISSKELHERINISSKHISPVVLLWERCLNKHEGKVKSALTEFLSTLEKVPKEFSFHMDDISSDLKYVELPHSQQILKTLGQWTHKLKDFDASILKNAEISIALASYVIGDQNTYTSQSIINKIQEKHKNFLLSLS
tara:strand:- start:483 stop:1214 length:732 start_codon:yes stop_codon:yes gene_type:complete